MQEQLKQAFMRGLCAMNLEAMNVLTPGEQPNANYDPKIGKLADSMSVNLTNIDTALSRSANTQNIGLARPQIYGNGSQNVQKLAPIQESFGIGESTIGAQSEPIGIRNLNPSNALSNKFNQAPSNPSVNPITKLKTQNLPDDLSTLTKEQLDMLYSQTLQNYSEIDEANLQTPQYDAIKKSGINTLSSLRQNVGTFQENERLKTESNVHVVRDPPPESREHLWRQAPVVGRKLGQEDDIQIGGAVTLNRKMNTIQPELDSNINYLKNQPKLTDLQPNLSTASNRFHGTSTRQIHEDLEALDNFQKYEQKVHENDVEFEITGGQSLQNMKSNMGMTLPSIGLSHIPNSSSHNVSKISNKTKSSMEMNMQMRKQAQNMISRNNKLDFGADNVSEKEDEEEDNGRVLRFNPKKSGGMSSMASRTSKKSKAKDKGKRIAKRKGSKNSGSTTKKTRFKI